LRAPGLDQLDLLTVQEDEHRRSVPIAYEVGRSHPRRGLAGGQRREPSLTLLRTAGRLDRRGRRGATQERRGGAGVAELLEQRRQLDRPEALSRLLAGHRDPRP